LQLAFFFFVAHRTADDWLVADCVARGPPPRRRFVQARAACDGERPLSRDSCPSAHAHDDASAPPHCKTEPKGLSSTQERPAAGPPVRGSHRGTCVDSAGVFKNYKLLNNGSRPLKRGTKVAIEGGLLPASPVSSHQTHARGLIYMEPAACLE
jgi:hypothetical protein